MRIIGNDPNTPRQTQVVASGTLSTGDTIVVNADGTVSAVAVSSASSGSSVNFDGLDGIIGLSYDSANGKVVIVYRDAGNSNYGTAIVGTVSGTSISFGTPVVFNTAATYGSAIAFDENSGKHVVIYQDAGNSSYGVSIVGTVSGTSISFGSEVVFESGSVPEMAIAYNSTAQKVVLFYRTSGQSNDGTLRVGTVSGTSISYGTVNRFEAGCENQTICYDSGNDKMVIAYRDGGSSDRGVARVATLSGTSISVGSEVVYQSGASFRNQIVYDPNASKIVIAYADEGNLKYGTAIAGEVSGTSITFGSKVVFAALEVSYLGITYDAKATQPIIVYQNGTTTSVVPVSLSGTTVSFGTSTTVDNSGTAYRQQIVYDGTSQNNVVGFQTNGNNGYAVVYSAASTNLTAENYIGTAKSGAADGDGVVVNTQGNVDTGQTGLTAGQSYYVQTDGTLSTTAGNPSVFAGTAVSATKLIVKG